MIQTITSQLPLRFLLLGLIFVVVIGMVLFVTRFLGQRSALRARLEEVRGVTSMYEHASSIRNEEISSGWNKLTQSIERAGISLVDTRGDTLRLKLIAAGYQSAIAPKIFTLLRLFLLFALPLTFVGFIVVNGQQVSLVKLYFIGLGSAVFGLYLPNLWISARADRRREQLTKGFPDCLDLMLVCVEAGLGLDAAFDRVGRELLNSHPLVSELLLTATLELRAGRSREEALRNMAERSQTSDIRSFCTLLIQSDKLGSSIGTTLRVYANEMREKRRMRAEEKAHRLPVLLSIPLVACMLPVMIGVLMLPAVIRVIRQLVPALAGGG